MIKIYNTYITGKHELTQLNNNHYLINIFFYDKNDNIEIKDLVSIMELYTIFDKKTCGYSRKQIINDLSKELSNKLKLLLLPNHIKDILNKINKINNTLDNFSIYYNIEDKKI